MKLEFSLLIVDDAPDGIEQAIETLADYLGTKGFTLDSRIVNDLSEQGLRQLARSAGKDYDLVMVDYNLGQPDIIDGAGVAGQLRRELPYTDMIFYSSISEADLLGELAKHSVPGVFVARRDNLDEALTGLADTVIGKAVDLNHMRGIAMAEVAEMDVLMEETLAHAFRHADSGAMEATKTRTIEKLRERVEGDSTLLQERLDDVGLSDVVRDSRLFTSAHKYQAIRRVAKVLPERPPELSALQSYENDIIRNRNMLAHVKEEPTGDGKTTLRSINGDVIIDDGWMTTFRQNLRTQRDALTTVCKAINDYFGIAEAPCDSEESQP